MRQVKVALGLGLTLALVACGGGASTGDDDASGGTTSAGGDGPTGSYTTSGPAFDTGAVETDSGPDAPDEERDAAPDSALADTAAPTDTNATDTNAADSAPTDTAAPTDTSSDRHDTEVSQDAAPDLPDGPDPVEGIVPLYGPETELEFEVHFDRGDAVVTRLADRGRDRHAREDQFQSYDHYLARYWEHRTARFLFEDYVTYGRSAIDVTFVTEWRLSIAEFRAWYSGRGTVAAYHGNYAGQVQVEGPGTYDDDLVQISDEGTQYRYTITLEEAILLNGESRPLEVGQVMEIEVSQFLEGVPSGRSNYYGTTFLYEVGVGGMVPWRAEGSFEDGASQRENSVKLDERAWLGGRTTLPYAYSGEPDNHFLQMATNLSSQNGQPFVLGRRVHHTDMRTGSHDESPENPTFTELVGLAGPRYVNRSCDSCHKRNGRAPVEEPGALLDKWVFKVGTDGGAPDPRIGAVLQPHGADGQPGEGDVAIARWVEGAEGLRAPEFTFSGGAPERFSARLAPQLVGMGLLEAIPEATLLERHDPDDADGDGVSGRAHVVPDPRTGAPRLGRLGWKAGATSVLDQTARALNTDMGVTTSLYPRHDCGADQTGCGAEGAELADEHLLHLVKYVSLLGVRARRAIDDPVALRGEEVFEESGCESCHRADVTTSAFHPLAELRGQRIHPYTDLLLHDLGPGLADSLGEGQASGAEWRTAPLWGIGLGPCVTGGVEGPNQQQVCTPHASYLHDGRARTLDEAIRWHGGEADAAREAYEALPEADREALLRFLRSL